ncbi:restriction endonuclease subunit S [Paenibacillus peoriae]|uniref:restriction endonuclease subunit S n=1 Tax=Paenibacillus peoriae TaxID=59893 RepID=UPI000CEC7FFD|nr:restriction endonuclease subunit S [Paenibacillus peoriae]PPQ48923.1 restriction endonuclease subunit S [Paenibacillus peoriae]
MSDKITKSPQIRFAGFTDAWEQRKLEDLIEQVIREVPKPDTPYLRLSVRSHAKGTFHQYVDDPSTVAMETLYVVRKKDLIVNITFAWEHAIAVAKESDDGLLVSHRFPTYRADGKSDIEFLEYLVSQEKFREKLKLISPGGAGRNRVLSKKDFIKLEVEVPRNIEEQTQIGNLFKQLDEAITLHQRKLELMKETKKSLLQKMFPKDGANVPEIRFAGFTDAWEQRKVGEFLTESKIKGSDGSIAKKLTVKLWRKGIVPKEEVYQGSSATQYYVRKSGQFMYGKLDFLNQAFGIVPPELDGYESTLDSPAFDFRDGINSRFFLEYISLKRFYKYQGNIANGSRKAKRIHAETFFEMPIPVPSYDEQQTIGLFFEQLDTTINLHQRELNSHKNLKKSLLQQMFI